MTTIDKRLDKLEKQVKRKLFGDVYYKDGRKGRLSYLEIVQLSPAGKGVNYVCPMARVDFGDYDAKFGYLPRAIENFINEYVNKEDSSND